MNKNQVRIPGSIKEPVSHVLKLGTMLTTKGHYGQREILAHAYPGSPMEWCTRPRSWSPVFPAFRAENARIREIFAYRRIQVPSRMHADSVDRDRVALEKHNFGLSWPPRDGCILKRLAHVDWHGGMESKGFAENILEVRHVFQCFISRHPVGAQLDQDFGTEFTPGVWPV